MMQDINSIWPKVLEELKKKVTEQQFNAWFRHLEPEGLLGTRVELRVPGPIYRDWLARRYKSLIEDAFASVAKEPVKVAFILNPSAAGSTSAGAERGLPASPKTHLDKKYTFENFVVGPCNRLAHAASLSVVSSPGYTYNPLFIYGGSGSGKSHLLQSMYFALTSKGIKALYIPCDAFVSSFLSALHNQQLEEFRKIYRLLDVFLLDDVQRISKSPSAKEELFHTINALFNRQRQVVLAASSFPDNIPGVEERLISRFKWGLLVKLEPADIETRVAIIEKTALLLDLPLSKEAATFLAENAPDNLKELERILAFLSSFYTLDRFPLSLVQVREALRGLLPARARAVHIEEILKAVASFFRIPKAQLQSKSQSRAISLPRQVAMYLARRFTTLSLEEVGGYLGGRDHSTVIHAEKRIKTLKTRSRDIDSIVSQIEASLQERC